MNFEKMILENVQGTDTKQMKELTHEISEFVENHLDEEQKGELMKRVYGVLSGGHFNKCFAKMAVEKMFYFDEQGKKHPAPYFTDSEVKDAFERHKDDVSDYTLYDFCVTMNMLRSDNNRFLHKYAKTPEEVKTMVVDMAVEYLQDDDSEHAHNKIWWYINK